MDNKDNNKLKEEDLSEVSGGMLMQSLNCNHALFNSSENNVNEIRHPLDKNINNHTGDKNDLLMKTTRKNLKRPT